MPTNAVIQFAAGTLPPDFCPESWQEGLLEFAARLSGFLPGEFTVWNFGESVPTVENRDKPWFKTPEGRTYFFYDGFWIARHPISPGIGTLYFGNAASVETFDGGEAGAVGDQSGPMWEVVTALSGRVPVGAGTLQPSGAILNPGDSGGADEITLTASQIPAHTHDVTAYNGNPLGSLPVGMGDSANPSQSINPTSSVGGGLPHGNMPPYSTVLFIRRTARLYYRI